MSNDGKNQGNEPPRRPQSGRPPQRPSQKRPPQRPLRAEADATPLTEEAHGERIAKVIARAGLCSRRDAEAWITAGRVEVNGVRIRSPALNVAESDKILVDGQPLAQRERTRLFLFHKPRGLVTTDRDPEGRPTIFSALPDDLPRVVTIGRLDINTEGLLLLTNDGGLARVLELPATGWVRRYRVRAKGTPDLAGLEALSEGITLDGIHYAGIVATLDRVQGANVWLTMALREGKNREVKRVLEHLGLVVNRLIRISFGPFQLGEIPEGSVEEVKTRVLRDQLGMTLAKEAGVDFVGPVVAPIVTVEENERRRNERAETRAFGDRSRPAPTRHSFGQDRGQDAPRDRERGRDRDRTSRTRTEAEPPPRRDRPKPGVRKHVSELRRERAETNAETTSPRRRVERAETSDRKGRSVTVERIRGPQETSEKSSRNSRRFAEGNDRAREHRRPDRVASGDNRGKDGPARRSGGPRPYGTASADKRGKDERAHRPSGPRSFGGAPSADKRGKDERPHRSGGSRPFGGAPSADKRGKDERPHRSGGSRPFGGAPSGDKRGKDERAHRSGGSRPFGGAPSGDKRGKDERAHRSGGSRPFGGAPSADKRGKDERPHRSGGSRPFGGAPSGDKRGKDERPHRSGGSRPFGGAPSADKRGKDERAHRSGGSRPFGGAPSADKRGKDGPARRPGGPRPHGGAPRPSGGGPRGKT